MPDDRPDFFPHTAAATQPDSRPDFIPHGGGADASGTMGAAGTPGAHARTTPLDIKGMAREGALGLISGYSGLPESKDIAGDTTKGELGYQVGQHISGDPNAPSAWEMMKQHNPLSGVIGPAQGLYSSAKEIATSPEQAGIAHGLGSFVGQLLQLSSVMKQGGHLATPEATAAARAIERHTSINRGQVQLVNGGVKAPIEMLDAKVNAEVGRHVDAVLAADELHNKITNNPAGYVDAVEAASVASKKSEQIGGEFANRVGKLIERANAGPMTMREAKALTTDVGREQNAMSNSGKSREAAVLAELYKGMHQETANRAGDLGADYSRSWQHYIDETSSYKDMKSGLLGELQKEPNHAKALDKLTNPDNAVEVKEIAAKMKQYGVDPKPFTNAKEVGQDLIDYSTQTKNLFQGKIRTILKYPYAAGPGAAGASVVAKMSGIPGMSFVLPLIVAAKIGGMLDNAAIRSILKDVGKRYPEPEMGQVHEPGAGPQPTPAPPVASPGMGRPAPVNDATPGQADDMAEAQVGEESRQALARKLSRTRSVYRGKR